MSRPQLGLAAQPSCEMDGSAEGREIGCSGLGSENIVGRWRELFPLLSSEIPSVRQGVSTCSKRRSIRVQRKAVEANSIIECLNEMYCAG